MAILKSNLWETGVWSGLPKAFLSPQLIQNVCTWLGFYQHFPTRPWSFLISPLWPPGYAEISVPWGASLKWSSVFLGSIWRWDQVAASLFIMVQCLYCTLGNEEVGPAHHRVDFTPCSTLVTYICMAQKWSLGIRTGILVSLLPVGWFLASWMTVHLTHVLLSEWCFASGKTLHLKLHTPWCLSLKDWINPSESK